MITVLSERPGAIDFSTTAELYSQLAGLLAGFAFAGLVALVTAQLSGGASTPRAFQSFVPLVGAFTGLISSSLNYAIIASTKANAPASLIETVAGIGFAVAGLMLFLSILTLLHGAASDRPAAWSDAAVRFVRRLTLLGVTPTVLLLLYGGTRDNETYRYGGNGGFHWVDFVDVAIMVFVVGYVCVRAFCARHNPPSAEVSTTGHASFLAVAVSLISVVGATFVQLGASESTTGPAILQVGLMGLLGGFAVLVTNASVKCR